MVCLKSGVVHEYEGPAGFKFDTSTSYSIEAQLPVRIFRFRSIKSRLRVSSDDVWEKMSFVCSCSTKKNSNENARKKKNDRENWRKNDVYVVLRKMIKVNPSNSSIDCHLLSINRRRKTRRTRRRREKGRR